jgi:hypothetical protein
MNVTGQGFYQQTKFGSPAIEGMMLQQKTGSNSDFPVSNNRNSPEQTNH